MKKDLRIIIKGNDLTESVLGWTMQVTTKGLSCGGVQWKEPVGSVYSIQFTDGTVEMLDGKYIEFKEAEEQNPKANKYAELFSAKLNNMDLVLLHKHKEWESWMEDEAASREEHPHFMISDNFDYFLCLKQHAKPCLHYLNGGSIRARVNNRHAWEEITEWSKTWKAGSCGFMSNLEVEIMPSKEEIRITNGMALREKSVESMKRTFKWFSSLGIPDSDEIEYYSDLAESIGFKAGQ